MPAVSEFAAESRVDEDVDVCAEFKQLLCEMEADKPIGAGDKNGTVRKPLREIHIFESAKSIMSVLIS